MPFKFLQFTCQKMKTKNCLPFLPIHNLNVIVELEQMNVFLTFSYNIQSRVQKSKTNLFCQ